MKLAVQQIPCREFQSTGVSMSSDQVGLVVRNVGARVEPLLDYRPGEKRREGFLDFGGVAGKIQAVVSRRGKNSDPVAKGEFLLEVPLCSVAGAHDLLKIHVHVIEIQG